MFDNLDRLKVFYYVLTHESVVGAAEVLHVSQPAVSQTIRKLEEELDTQLFTRLHKQLIPTAAGKKLYAIISPLMGELTTYLKELKVAKNHPSGELSIAAPPEFGKAYLPAIIADFRELYEDVTFNLRFGTPQKLLPLLKSGEVDYALVDLFLTQSTHIGSLDLFNFQAIVEEEVILACSGSYAEHKLKHDFSFGSLVRQNFISYREDTQEIRQWFKHHFGKVSIDVRNILTVNSHKAVISAISSNAGMGIVASHLVNNELLQQQIVHIKTHRPEIVNTISLVSLQDKIPTFTEKTFVRYLLNKINTGISRDRMGLKVLLG